jgi:hypothetical protein
MLYSEIIAVCSQIHIKRINTLCGQNVEFCNVNIKIEWATHVACMQKSRSAYRVLVEKPEGRRPLGRRRRRWEDTIKMDLKEVRWGTYSIHMAHDTDRLL